ncbi:MAG: murein L,D-transpeptidase [Acidimicrobiia bacterium]|nr:murein L,D-transpeptidase [Acidimicrobiia bacterium]
MRRLFALLVVVALGSLVGCSANQDDRPTLAKEPARNSPTTTSTLPSYISLVAEARVLLVQVFPEPDDTTTPSNSFGNPWFVNDDRRLPVKQVFLVKQAVDDWYEVYLPVRPNGTTGWIRSRDVTIIQSPYRIVVELSAHRITVYNGDSILLQESVAIGKPSTPTPPGTYYTRVLLKAPDPNTVYGPYAYPLSGHSDVLTSFNGGDGELGIHGNNDASVLGQSVTAGCIRMSNEGITSLAPLITLGSPVEILA